jgi:cytidylate kinase
VAPVNYEPVITVSATYGAGGSVIAPRLARELGLPYVDRLISADAANRPDQPVSQEGLAEGEEEPTPAGRFLSYFARAATVGAVVGPEPDLPEDSDIRARTEADLQPILAGQPGVVLGRAAAVVLARRPRAFHVRLDGPVERRIAWAAPFEQIDLEAARRRQSETDRARTSFVKKLYHTDPAHPSHYHLLLDPTVIGIDAAVEVIKTAASAFFNASAR